MATFRLVLVGCLLSILLQAVLIESLIAADGESVEWLDVMGDSLSVLKRLEPAGEEGIPSHLYVCRGYKNNRWSPGKLYMSHDKYYYQCGYPEGKENSHTVGHKNNVQVLVTPPGWTSWVPVTDRYNLPPRPISGGTHHDGVQAYVCRHTDGSGRMFPGKYHDREGKCYYAYYGQKSAESNMEVLTINMFGSTMQRAMATQRNSTHVF